jgi:putative exporter of polyketide antibiotics
MAPMLLSFLRTIVKVAVASLIVGTILAHFGIDFEALTKEFGLSPQRIESVFRRGLAWLLPNIMLGALIIVPVWLLVFILRPPGQSRE